MEALCDRVSIIRAGRTVQTGTLSELRHLTRTSITAETAHPPVGLDGLPGVHGVLADDGRVSFDVDTVHLSTAIGRLVELGLTSLTSQPPTLEELFLRHYGDELSGDGGGPGPGAGR